MVCYDVEQDSARRRIAEILKDHGERVQWSVFECHLDQDQMAVLRQRLLAEINQGTDSVRWYPICVWCRERVAYWGAVGKTDDPPYFMV